MSTSGILIIYIGVFIRSIIRFKGRKDYTNIFKLNVIIIENIGGRKDDNFNNSDNKNYKKIKNFKPNKYHGKQEKFKFWLF